MAKFHLDSLSTRTNPRDVKNALDQLPTVIGDVYHETMERIESQPVSSRHVGYRTLCWLTFARTRLSVSQLRHALAACALTGEDQDDALDDDCLEPLEIIISACAGLVVKQGKDVQLVRELLLILLRFLY